MTRFLEAVLNGGCVGAAYALIGLGFVIIYKSTGVLNFAQGAMMLLGAYLVYNLHVTWGLPFYVALVLAVAAGALVGALIEELVLRFFVGQQPFAQIMVTVGVLFVLQQIVEAIWGTSALQQNDPWALRTVTVFDAIVPVAYVWRAVFALVVFVAFFLFFRYSLFGLAMRASALDAEAAMAQGISPRRVAMVAWAMAGACATLAGASFTTGAAVLEPTVQFVALAAFPAIILGGLDSPGGAVVGGLSIGIIQTLASTYVPIHAQWAGAGFDKVVPYLVMVVLLLVRPYGLFGTKEVRRV
ncbi:MAG: branched-chain amino acid ABC transporter permease [Acidimicrobiia bacterium]